MDARLIRTPGLYLVGFMGCGKTTVGEMVADELGWYFGDLDADIEAAAGRTIPDIFDGDGEPEFRRLEHQALLERVKAIQRGTPTVLSLGGGAFAQDNNIDLVIDNGISVWLDCPFEIIEKRTAAETHRPLARDRVKFAALYEARREAYAKAHYRVAIESDDASVAVRAILELPVL